MSWEDWLAALDEVADKHNCDRQETWSAAVLAKWQGYWKQGLTPQQAWDAEPWRRR